LGRVLIQYAEEDIELVRDGKFMMDHVQRDSEPGMWDFE
jgi:hypothetical protein